MQTSKPTHLGPHRLRVLRISLNREVKHCLLVLVSKQSMDDNGRSLELVGGNLAGNILDHKGNTSASLTR